MTIGDYKKMAWYDYCQKAYKLVGKTGSRAIVVQISQKYNVIFCLVLECILVKMREISILPEWKS